MNQSLLRRLFKIQYVSDLHLEFYNSRAIPKLIKPHAPYLALAGDIGYVDTPIYNDFFQYASKQWEHIFYVAGNHEFFDTHITERKHNDCIPLEVKHMNMKSYLDTFPNVHYLHGESPSYYLAHENVVIIGSTLWSHIPKSFMELAQDRMSDYKFISYTNKDGVIMPLTAEKVNEMHNNDKTILYQEIQKWENKNIPSIVMTHHMPSYEIIKPTYKNIKNSIINCCFASSCEHLIRPSLKAWIYGHTHYTSFDEINGVKLLCNSRGYPDETMEEYKTYRVFEFYMGDHTIDDCVHEIQTMDPPYDWGPI